MKSNQVQIHRKITKLNITDTLLSMNVSGYVLIKNSDATTEQVRNSISRLKGRRKKLELPEMSFTCTSDKDKIPVEYRAKCDTYVTRAY